MNFDNDRISELLFRNIIGKLSEEDTNELEFWRNSAPENEILYQKLSDYEYLKSSLKDRKTLDTEKLKSHMEWRLKHEYEKRFIGLTARQWSVTASIIVICCFGFSGGWYLNGRFNADKEQQLIADNSVIQIVPGKTQALLTTPTGDTLSFDNDMVASDIHYDKDDSYRLVTEAVEKEVNNLCLDVPRGGEFKIVLEDLTEVWLNSDSKLIYPEHFGEKDRKVSVEGEAYFKVTTDFDRPFYVETSGQMVRVYGTEFNIRSYSEDELVYTTLVEGSISLSPINDRTKELMLTPGFQARFEKTNSETSILTVDSGVVTSWKHGKFVFENQTLRQIMQDLSRWYDFEYTFEDESASILEFIGSIPRYADFNTALSILEMSGDLRFDISGKKVKISITN